MTQTTNIGLKKIDGSENWRQIFDYYNDSADKTDSAVAAVQDGLAIVANGNTHAAVAEGQFVYVRNHSTLAEGLYKASSAIGTNGELTTSNLTADGSGGLNDLQEQVTSLNSNIGSFRTFVYNISASSDAECISSALTDILTRMTEGVFIARIIRTNAWAFVCYGSVHDNVAVVECYNEYNGNTYIYKKQSGQDVVLVATLQKQVVRQSVTMTVTVPASNIHTTDISIASAPANLLVIAGYEISSATGILVEQIYLSNASTIHCRLQNENAADTTCTLTVYYI